MKKTLAFVLAMMMLAVCVCAAAEEAVMTYEEYAAAELETEVTIEAYVQAKQGWWAKEGVGRCTLYLADENGAYFVYDLLMERDQAEALVPGTKLCITGYKTSYQGEIEIDGTDASFTVLEADPFIAEPVDVTDLLAAENLIDYQNRMVAVKGAKIVAKKDANGNDVAFLYNWDGSGQAGGNCDLYFDVEVNGAVYTFTVESYLCGEDTEVYQAVTALNIGDVVDLEGFLYWYNGANPHITSVKAAE